MALIDIAVCLGILSGFHVCEGARQSPPEIIIESRRAHSVSVAENSTSFLKIEKAHSPVAGRPGTDLTLPPLDSGVHRLTVRNYESYESITIPVASKAALQLENIARTAKFWWVNAALTRFALYEVLSEEHGSDWGTWPQELKSPDGPASRTAAKCPAAQASTGRTKSVCALTAGSATDYPAFQDYIHKTLASSTGAMVSVQMDDILGVKEAQKLPGAVEERPNWRRHSGVPLELLNQHNGLSLNGQIMPASGKSPSGVAPEKDIQ